MSEGMFGFRGCQGLSVGVLGLPGRCIGGYLGVVSRGIWEFSQFPVIAQLVKRVNGFKNVQKVGKTRPLFLVQ